MRHARDGNEGHHIGGADARVRALVLVQVDQLRGLADAAQRRFAHTFAGAHKRDHRTVVVGVHLLIEQIDFRPGEHRLDDRLDFRASRPSLKLGTHSTIVCMG